jgi:hypothetical protein
MPEVISKHPEITMQVLQGAAGVTCGAEAQQRILTQCPQERFCATPTGEICVYGLNEIPQMTQINRSDLMRIIAAPPLDEQEVEVLPLNEQGVAVPIQEVPADPMPAVGPGSFILILLALAAGVVLGIALSKRLRSKKI